ncbi:MAG: group II intron maturase-specific domain-containing protein [Candidatus Thiodiazotropha sp.]
MTFRYRGGICAKGSTNAEKILKEKMRRLTRRTRGLSLRQDIAELRKYLLDWKASYGIFEVKRYFVDLDKWIRR